jgi:pilus assembly protein CpaC
MAKVLSEPTLTTLTGQEAQFLSGGEFPIPVPQGGTSNAITITFKEFGVGVKFLPVVLDSGHINLTLNVNVSELTSNNQVVLSTPGTTSTFLIPSLTKRSASSTIELANGQTIGIAGLINDNVRQFVDKLPGLGDIPLLGALFRSQEYRSGKTELVIFVTPHLARPIAPQQVRLPTDSFVPPDDLEFYLLGRMEGRKGPKPANVAPAVPRTTERLRFGHDM